MFVIPRTFIAILLLTVSFCHCTVLQQTLYSFSQQKAYIRLTNNDLISIDFDQDFTGGGSTISSSAYTTLASAPSNASLSYVNDNLFAFYNDGDNMIAVSMLNETSNEWEDLDVSNDFTFYNYSTYLTTLDNQEKIYIYGGISVDNSSDVSDRLLEFDVLSYTLNDNISSSVTPTNFYGASNLLINYNTQLVIGGKASNGWVSLKQLAMWQYESWSFKTVSMSSDINSRKFAQALPIFDNSGSNNVQQLDVEGAILIGGNLIDGYSTPKIIKLNITSWEWTSLDDELDSVDLDTVLGSCVIYDTLITFSDSSSSSSKKKRDTGSYTVQLFDVSSSVSEIDTINYSSKTSSSSSSSSSNSSSSSSNKKKIIIAVSIVIPIVAIALICVAVYFYWKSKKSRDLTNNFDSFDIMDLYNNLSKKNSINYGHDEVKVNNYDDNDNLSIDSWRRKREQFDKAYHKRETPQPNMFSKTAPESPVQLVGSDRSATTTPTPTPHRNESLLRRSLSNLSNFSKTFSLRNKMITPMPNIAEDSLSESGTTSSYYHLNEKSASTLQFSEEDFALKQGHDLKSILSATTYYEDAPQTPGDMRNASSPSINRNRFSDLTMIQPPHPSFDTDDIDQQDIDVQVLVSSKRRSKLRVTNPDVVRDDMDDEQEMTNTHDPDMYIERENVAFMDELFEMIDHDDVGDNTQNEISGTRKRIVSGDKQNEN